MIKHTIRSAKRKEGVTLDELAAFVQDVLRTGASGDEKIFAGVSFGGKLQWASVSVVVVGGESE
jgi:hypothetical protein